MRRILWSSAALLAFISGAQAADLATKIPATKMPLKAPSAPTPAYDWSGFYLGGYYGAAWSHSNASTPNLREPGALKGAVDLNSSSYTAGITAGYNLQLSPYGWSALRAISAIWAAANCFRSSTTTLTLAKSTAGTRRCAGASVMSPAHC